MGVTLAAELNAQVVLAQAFREHYGDVRRFAYARTNAAVADDIASETFARAVRLWPAFDPAKGSVRAWLFGIAANIAHEHDRSERRRRAALSPIAGERDGETPGDAGAGRIEDAEIVTGLLSKLRPPVRDVLLLVGGFGLSYEEAAVALGIPLGTVASRMSAGRRQFKRLLGASETANMARRRWQQ